MIRILLLLLVVNIVLRGNVTVNQVRLDKH